MTWLLCGFSFWTGDYGKLFFSSFVLRCHNCEAQKLKHNQSFDFLKLLHTLFCTVWGIFEMHSTMECFKKTKSHHGYIYWIKNILKTLILWKLLQSKITVFYFIPVMSKLNFQHLYSSLLRCHMILKIRAFIWNINLLHYTLLYCKF